jgi:hypothetical protein
MAAQRDHLGVRLSSSLPPAGFTRGEPSPPVRRRVLQTPWLPVAAAALAIGAGFFAIGSGADPVSPAGTVVPDAATPPPASPPSATAPSPSPPSLSPPAVPPPVPSPGRPGKAAPAREGEQKPAGKRRQAPGREGRPPRVRDRPMPGRAHPRSAAPRPAPRGVRPRPPVRHPGHKARPPRTVRPATPSWIAAECRRRFPDDPGRRDACAAVLARTLGG